MDANLALIRKTLGIKMQKTFGPAMGKIEHVL